MRLPYLSAYLVQDMRGFVDPVDVPFPGQTFFCRAVTDSVSKGDLATEIVRPQAPTDLAN
jgi:hypothetical protein